MKTVRQRAVYWSLRQVMTAAMLAVVFVAAFILMTKNHVYAAQTVPYKVNFQGRLANSAGTAMADGQYNMIFRLYSVSTGGTPIWTETRDTTNRVQVTNGVFSVQLGDITALSPSVFTSQPLYFEVELPTPATATCSTAGCASFTEGAMTPRQPLGASPYAMNADTLDGVDLPNFARQDANNTFTGTQLFKNASNSATSFQIQNATGGSLFVADTSSMSIKIGGGDVSPDGSPVLLVLDYKNTTGDPTCTNGAMYYNSSSSQAKMCINGSWTSLGVPTVTSLPSSPSDGDEAYYVVDAANGINWHLRYNAGSASAYKWEFVGGSPLRDYVDNGDSPTATNTWQDLPTVGPQVTLPLAGDYLIEYGISYRGMNGTSTTGKTSISLGGAAPADTTLELDVMMENATFYNGSSLVGRKNGIAANTLVKVQYQTANVNSMFNKRWLKITPIRVD